MTGRNRPTIIEPSQEIPVLLDVDVAVAGGGTAGPIAAISAARQGAKVVMIERFGSLGGNLTIGLNTKPSGVLPGGLPRELWDRARSIGAAGEDYMATLKHGQEAQVTAPTDPELMKILLARMCREAGVQLLFETYVSRPIVEEHTVTGLIVESKGGRQAIRAGVVVDCSADADVAAKAGAPFFIGTGGGEDSMQPVGMYFTVRDVDLMRLANWARESLDDIPERHIPDTEEGLGQGLWLTGFNRMVRGFQARTGLEMKRESITLKTAGGVMFVNATRVLGVSGLSPLEISEAILDCYDQIENIIRFLREDVPGFEVVRLGGIAPMLGVRETRHIDGEYVLTGADATEGKSFEDSITVDLSISDIHDVAGADVALKGLPPYEIPYRSLLPRNVEQLLVAGRSIAADHIAHGRSREIPACMATAQAAGIASALALRAGKTVRNLDVAEIQRVLREIGMPYHSEHLP